MKSALGKLTPQDIATIKAKTTRKSPALLVAAKPVQISLNENLNAKIAVLSAAQDMPAEKFVEILLKEDIDRLWKLYQKIS